jgi:hypothetical protein
MGVHRKPNGNWELPRVRQVGAEVAPSTARIPNLAPSKRDFYLRALPNHISPAGRVRRPQADAETAGEIPRGARRSEEPAG